MNFFAKVRDRVIGAIAGGSVGAESLHTTGIMAEARQLEEWSGVPTSTEIALIDKTKAVLESSIAELELAFEDAGWKSLGTEYGTWNFKRSTLRRIVGLSRVMYLINPLIKRAVTVQELYVWGRGVKIEGETAAVDAVLQDFFKDPKNQTVIGQAWAEREREQRIEGNTFFCFYVNPLNGSARVRVMPVDQVEDIVYNPDDSKEPWLYLRCQPSVNMEGIATVEERVYYPDINYNPRRRAFRSKYNAEDIKIDWSVSVYHLKTGGLSSQKFGLPELFSTLNWATGYKRILENFATILAAYARMAMQVTGLPGKKGVAAAKNKLNTTVSSSNARDSNPPNTTAAWFLASGGAEIKPVKTAGSTTGPDEARALRSMVAAGSDTPEHFFGDSEIGSFATSSTLDRPTELKMVSRQTMWVGVIQVMCNKVIEWSATSYGGKLYRAGYRARVTRDPFDGANTVMVTSPKDQNTNVLIEFPNILERDVTDRVRSIVQAVTLGGSHAEGIIPDRKVVCGMLLEALGERDASRLTNILYPESVIQGFIDPDDIAQNERLAAQGKQDLGDAALQQAAAAKINAAKPTPKPSGSPASGGRN